MPNELVPVINKICSHRAEGDHGEVGGWRLLLTSTARATVEFDRRVYLLVLDIVVDSIILPYRCMPGLDTPDWPHQLNGSDPVYQYPARVMHQCVVHPSSVQRVEVMK